MALGITLTPGYGFPDGTKVGNAQLRLGANPTAEITGELEADQLGSSAVTPAKVKAQAFFHGVDAGSTDAYVVTLSPAIDAYADGLWLWFEPNTSNTGTCTLNVNGKGAKTIFKQTNQALEDGDLRKGQKVLVIYDTAADSGAGGWQLMSNGGREEIPYVEDASASPNTISVTLPIFLSGIPAGLRMGVKIANTNTAACVVNVTVRNAAETLNSIFGGAAIKKHYNQDLAPNDLRAGQVVDLMFNGSYWELLSAVANPPTTAAVAAAAVNLVGSRPTVATVSITADELILKTAAGVAYLASAVSASANITTAGAGGLDSGAEAASKWYYVWAIYNGTTVSLLVSLANGKDVNYLGGATSDATWAWGPALPSGYTYRALVGVVRNNSSSDFVEFVQTGRRFSVVETVVFTAQAGNTSGTTVSIADYAPGLAKSVSGQVGVIDDSDGIKLAANASSVGAVSAVSANLSGAIVFNGFVASAPFDIVLTTAQQLWYQTNSTNAAHRLTVNGYSI